MSPKTMLETKIANKTIGKRALKNRNPKIIRRSASLKRGGLEIAQKSDRRASSGSLSLEEINANLNRLEVEMAERQPRRSSSKWKMLKRRFSALQLLKRGGEGLRGRILSEAEHHKEALKALEEEKEDIARERAMNKEEKEEIRVLNEWLNHLVATALLGPPIQAQME